MTITHAWPSPNWPPKRIELVGSRVTISQFSANGAPQLHEALDDDRLWTHVPRRPASQLEWEQVARAGIDSGTRWVLVVRESASGTIIGTSSYYDVDIDNAGIGVGYTVFAQRAWGTDLTLETKLLMLGYAFDECMMARVQFQTDSRNLRSAQAMTNWGATREGVLRMHKRRTDGTLRDSVVFSVVADDWSRVREQLIHMMNRRTAGIRPEPSRSSD